MKYHFIDASMSATLPIFAILSAILLLVGAIRMRRWRKERYQVRIDIVLRYKL